jgi:hypothetical protein
MVAERTVAPLRSTTTYIVVPSEIWSKSRCLNKLPM